ncbi:type II secretion system protein GspL [Parahaliea maris]|uniref:Type II secretion system protein L n=1 Tax=Parahaliea maris TaxID=2716870 RepID=A0A5C9A9F3_9GAMM|nr:type II secretion system protein GspL [Parahaliea maris]TXS96280.1 type II secretion system protein GspL [Parahaliea maris]
MHNIAVIRLLDEQLLCYPPGAGEQPLPLDSAEAFKSLRDSVAGNRWSLCFAAPAAAIRLLTLDVAAEEKKHLAQSLPFTLEEQVAEDIDGLHFAMAPLERLHYGVAICQHECMLAWQEQLAALDGITHWVPETLLLPWQAGEWCLLLEGERAIVRSGACAGFGCERELLPLLLEAALREGSPDSVVIYGSDQAADCELLPQALREKVQWRRGNLCSALLLVDSLPPLNLNQGPYAARLPLQRWWREWRLVASVLAAVFCLQLLATWLEYRSLADENLRLRAAREASYRQAYPQGAVVDPEKQLQRQLDAMRGTGGGSGFVPLLDRVGKVLAGEPGTRLASLNYTDRGGEMRMNIVASDYESVERIRAGINASGLNATMESSNAQGDGVRARIRVEGRG